MSVTDGTRRLSHQRVPRESATESNKSAKNDVTNHTSRRGRGRNVVRVATPVCLRFQCWFLSHPIAFYRARCHCAPSGRRLCERPRSLPGCVSSRQRLPGPGGIRCRKTFLMSRVVSRAHIRGRRAQKVRKSVFFFQDMQNSRKPSRFTINDTACLSRNAACRG